MKGVIVPLSHQHIRAVTHLGNMQLYLQGLGLQEEARKEILHWPQQQELTLKAWEAVAQRCPDIQNTWYVYEWGL